MSNRKRFRRILDRQPIDLLLAESILAQERQKHCEEKIVRPEFAPVRLRRIEPAGIVRQENASEMTAFLHANAEVEMARQCRTAHTVKGNPRTTFGRGDDVGVTSALRVHPDERTGINAMIPQHVEFRERRAAARVHRDGEPGRCMGERGGGDEVLVDQRQRRIAVDAALDEAGADPRI